MRVTTRFVEGRFPKWQEVIPTPEIHHTIRVGDLLRAVRLVSTTTSADDRAVLMQLSETGCRLSSETETGSGAVEVDCGGDGAVEIRVMAEYLSQALQSFGADSVIEIGTIASDQAMLLSCGPVRQVIMPITAPT
jgi:DNA polymerase III sliding clamp (beta) subunit (PCNA family)